MPRLYAAKPLRPSAPCRRSQHLRGFGVPAEAHVDVRAQELDVVDDLLGHAAVDPVERVQRVVELAFLEVDAREPIRGIVAHGFVDVAFEHGRDRAAGAVVHAVVELEVADRELGLAQMRYSESSAARRGRDAGRARRRAARARRSSGPAARSRAPRRNTSREPSLLVSRRARGRDGSEAAGEETK